MVRDDEVRPRYVGFYWTLPVKWKAFYSLPPENTADAAVKKSRTIAYQRALVRDYVEQSRGVLFDEVPFMDLEPDRATPHVVDKLKPLRALCTTGGATLLYVDFKVLNGWRPNVHLEQYLEKHRFNYLGIAARRIFVPEVNEIFDPRDHFKGWRLRDNQRAQRHQHALEGLIGAVAAVSEQYGRYARMLTWLKEHKYETATGRPWTIDNIKQQVKRHGLLKTAEDEAS